MLYRAVIVWYWLLKLVGLCPHDTMIRERREVMRGGKLQGVLHYVCDDCGYAVPVLSHEKDTKKASLTNV